MAGGGEFLAGLLSALSDSYGQVQAENKRISLLKQQMDQQRSIAEQQLSLAREGQSQRDRIENRQLDIQEKLGGRRLDIDEKGQNQQAAQDEKRNQLALILKAMDGAQQSGNIKLEGQLRTEAMRLQAELQSAEADRGVVRQQAIMSYEDTLRQAGEARAEGRQIRGEKRAEGAAIRAETRKSTADSEAEDRQMVKALLGKVMHYAVDGPEEYANTIKSLELGLFDAAARADLANPGSNSMGRLRGMLEQIDTDLEAGREAASGGAMLPQALEAVKALKAFKDNPEGALQSILISKAGPQDWSKVGQARPGMKIDLTAKPQAQTPAGNVTNDLNVNLKDPDSVATLVNRTDWLRSALNTEWEDIQKSNDPRGKPAFDMATGDVLGGVRRWITGPTESDKMMWLGQMIDTAPGATMTEKVQNAARSFRTFSQPAIPQPAPIDFRRTKGSRGGG